MSSTRYRVIPVDRIRPCPSNPRFEATDLNSLAASIKSVGVLEPLLVAYDPTDPEYVTTVAGSRRLAASKLAGLTEVPCIVQPPMSQRTELVVSLVENLHRRDLSPIEKGESFLAICETGRSQTQVAEMVGLSQSTISMCIKVARDLIPEIRQAVHEGRIPFIEAVAMSRHSPELQMRLWLAPKTKNKDPRGRKSRAHVCLEDAIAAHRVGDDDVALEKALAAVEQLQRRIRMAKAAA